MASGDLERVASRLVADGKGILAADETVPRPRTSCNRSSERDQPAARLEALEDQFLLRARAPGSGAGGLAWPG